MSLFTDLASSTSVLLFGPPAPIQKDMETPSAPAALEPNSIKVALLKPQLGLVELQPRGMSDTKRSAKQDELPLPPPPEDPTSILINVGVSAFNLLGSAVAGVGSAAVSALTFATEPSNSSTEPAVQEASETAREGTFLGTLSTALLARAVSARDAAVASATSSASSFASTAAHAISDAATASIDYATGTTLHHPRSPNPIHDASNSSTVKRSCTMPVQLSATGEPFSSDPSISAMQRIPDHPCGHHTLDAQRKRLVHCCSAPDVLASRDEQVCSCKCTAIDGQANEVGKDGCDCSCHSITKRQSGHFHRVEQLVKGTKRVVRDIKNVI